MEIESVELLTFTDNKDEVPNFCIHYKDTKVTTTLLSDAVTNRHYEEIRQWYADQKKKPFKFDFVG